MEHNLLFVDDEINVVKGIRRLFMRSNYNVFIETDCAKALDIMRNNKVSVLVSDMRMPEMNGAKLIKLANEIDPMTVKIILSGYSDIDDIMAAINEGHIYSYITKPWHDAGLKLMINNSCDYYEKKIREKELISELRKKHEELVYINKNLEKLVEERSNDIIETNTILNYIIAGSDKEIIYGRIAKNLLEINKRAASVLIIENGQPYYYGDNKLNISNFQNINTAKQIMNYKNMIVYPIVYSNELIGAFILEKNDSLSADHLLKRISSLKAAAKLYITQQMAINDSGKFIEKIDNMIGELSDD